MATGYEALSEKERETQRLLPGGHDAKSIARHLGLQTPSEDGGWKVTAITVE